VKNLKQLIISRKCKKKGEEKRKNRRGEGEG
jgi:hypothetical protein